MPRFAPITLVLASVVMITGCTSTPAAVAPEPDARQVVLDTLGPFPADSPWTEDEREQALIASSDSYWSRVTMLFPSAERPDVERVAEVSPDESNAQIAACLNEAGVSLASPGEFSSSYEGDNLAWYACNVRYPTVPRPPVNDEQLGYIYDYLTGFVAPCLEKLGLEVEAPPTRKFFIEQWPNQNWYPAPAVDGELGELEAIGKECPSSAGY